jgi:hypothetical protein
MVIAQIEIYKHVYVKQDVKLYFFKYFIPQDFEKSDKNIQKWMLAVFRFFHTTLQWYLIQRREVKRKLLFYEHYLKQLKNFNIEDFYYCCYKQQIIIYQVPE